MQQKNLIGLVIATSLGLSSLAGCVVAPTGAVKPGTAAGTGATKPGGQVATTPTTGLQPAKTEPKAPAQPVAVGKVPAAEAQAGAIASQETAAAMAEEREMEDYDALADQEGAAAAYGLQMVGAAPAGDGMVAITGMLDGDLAGRGGAGTKQPRTGELGIDAIIQARLGGGKLTADQETKLRAAAGKIEVNLAAFQARRDALKAGIAALELSADVLAKVKARRQMVGEKAKARLGKLRDAREKIRGAAAKAPWVTNEDGSKTRTLAFDVTRTVNGKTFTRKAKLVRTINAEGALVLASADFEQALPNGLTRVSSRTKTLNADGSYSVVFHSEITLPKGGKRVAHWEKEIAADGTVTGTGKIVWTDAAGAEKKVVTVALGGSEEAPSAAVEDEASGAEAEVVVDADGAIEATVEGEDGETAAVTIDTAEDGTVEVADGEGDAIAITADGTIVVADGEGNVITAGDGGVVAADASGDVVAADGDGGIVAIDADASGTI